MITTDFVPGSPCWVDLGAPDVPAAAEFYGAVLGWDFEVYRGEDPQAEAEAGEYGILRSDGKAVGAIGPLTEEGARSAWMIYFRTDDVQATTRAVEQAGGTVRVAPMDAGGWAWMAQYTDPLGAQFAVWQPGKSPGLEAVDRVGSLNWIELYTTDSAAALRFYGAVFGWQTSDMPLPGDGGTYTMITPAGLPEERMHGGVMQVPTEMLALNRGRPYWHPVFAIADCDAATATVTARGGSVQMGPTDMPDVGRLSVCVDPNGADFVLLTPAPR